MVEEQDDGTWVPPTTSDFLTLDGTEVQVARWQPTGGAAMAPPLLLVHGLGGSTVLWERVAGELAGGFDADLRRLQVPTLLVHGDHDRVVPIEFARALVRKHPPLELALVENCGHVPHLECPKRFVEAVAPHLERTPPS